jgi:hypothetical protein
MCSAWDAFGCGKMIFPCAARHVSHLTSLDITWPCSKHGRVVAHAPKLSKCCECHPPDEIQIQIISDPKMLGFALTRVMVKAPWPTSWLTFLKLYVYDVYMDCSIWSIQYLCPNFQLFLNGNASRTITQGWPGDSLMVAVWSNFAWVATHLKKLSMAGGTDSGDAWDLHNLTVIKL